MTYLTASHRRNSPLLTRALGISALASLLVTMPFAAFAEDPPAAPSTTASSLQKAEVETFVGPGKKVSYLRKRDGSKSSWEFRGGDDVFYSTTTTQRNVQIAGTYRITKDGAVCFKWNQDKFMAMQDGCYRFRREADVLHVVSYRDPDQVIGDVVSD